MGVDDDDDDLQGWVEDHARRIALPSREFCFPIYMYACMVSGGVVIRSGCSLSLSLSLQNGGAAQS